MRAYSYVIVSDKGAAPNYDKPKTTLAICKPKIRLRANVGDVVIGFTGKSLGDEPHSVRWAGIVSEKMTFNEYWGDRRFTHKKPGKTDNPDNIYRPKGNKLVQVSNSVHDIRSISTDVGGEYVLIFDPAWRFGDAAPVLPEKFGLRVLGGRRGHRSNPLSPQELEGLKHWLNGQAAKVHLIDIASTTKLDKVCTPATRPRCR